MQVELRYIYMFKHLLSLYFYTVLIIYEILQQLIICSKTLNITDALFILSLFSILHHWKVEELTIMHQLGGKEDQELKSRNAPVLEADMNSYQQIQSNLVCMYYFFH